MKAGSVFWVLASLAGAVIVNLVSSQIDAWLPSLARMIVLRQAKRMGDRAERCAEEWLATLSETRGGLAHLWFAVGTLKAPLRLRIELLRNHDACLFQIAGAYLDTYAAWLTIPAAALLFSAYPYSNDRRAAYAVVVPFLFLSALWLVPSIRRRIVETYDWLSYWWRVGVGGLTLVLALYFAGAWSRVPPSFSPPNKGVVEVEPLDGPMLVFVASIDFQVDLDATDTHGRPLHRSVTATRVEQFDTAPQSLEPGTDLLSSRMFDPAANWYLGLSALPAIPMPAQPIPSPQDFEPPPPVAITDLPQDPTVLAPTNLRIFASGEN